MTDKEFVNAPYVKNLTLRLNEMLMASKDYLADAAKKNRIDSKLADKLFKDVKDMVDQIKKLDTTNYKAFNTKHRLGDTIKDTQQFIRTKIRKLEQASKNYEGSSDAVKESYAKHLESLTSEYAEFSNRIKLTGEASKIQAIIDKVLQFNNLWDNSKVDELVNLMKKSGDHNAHPNNVYAGALKYINKLYSKIPEVIKEDASMRTKISEIENIINGFESTIKNKSDMKDLTKEVAGAVQSGLDQAGKLVGGGIKTSVNLAKKALTGKVGIDK